MHAVFEDRAAVVQLVGAVLIGLVGVFVLTVRPRLRANVAFAVFTIAFGLSFVLTNVGAMFLHDDPQRSSPGISLVRGASYVAITGATLWLAAAFPAPLPAQRRRLLSVPVLGAFTTTPALLVVFRDPPYPFGLHDHVFFTAYFLVLGAIGSLPAFYALRYATTREPGLRARCLLVSAATVLYVGVVATAGPFSQRETSVLSAYTRPLLLPVIGMVVLAAGLWLWNARDGPDRRQARDAALLCAAMPLVGLVYVATGQDWGILGIVRTLMVVLLAYGIVRQQFLGLDVKLRWTISKSTIAGVFVAAFFIASEVAQEFFGARTGSQYVGIVAAGALVFAIAPLSRLADRVAARAVPADDAAGPPVAAQHAYDADEETYRVTLRRFLEDRKVSREEELHLARLATRLGLDAQRATRIRHEEEDAVAARRDAEAGR